MVNNTQTLTLALAPNQCFCHRASCTLYRRAKSVTFRYCRLGNTLSKNTSLLAGNQWLHRITGQASYELRVELLDWEENTSHALYEVFRVENLKKKYSLVVDIYSGDAGKCY